MCLDLWLELVSQSFPVSFKSHTSNKQPQLASCNTHGTIYPSLDRHNCKLLLCIIGSDSEVHIKELSTARTSMLFCSTRTPSRRFRMRLHAGSRGARSSLCSPRHHGWLGTSLPITQLFSPGDLPPAEVRTLAVAPALRSEVLGETWTCEGCANCFVKRNLNQPLSDSTHYQSSPPSIPTPFYVSKQTKTIQGTDIWENYMETHQTWTHTHTNYPKTPNAVFAKQARCRRPPTTMSELMRCKCKNPSESK